MPTRRGLATEAARAAMRYGFDELALAEIVAFTARDNERSRRTMERLGMKRDPAEDFKHPQLQKDDPLSAHVLYRIGPSGFRL
jgi:RimJ/RimL family protein N-acetyltransferase